MRLVRFIAIALLSALAVQPALACKPFGPGFTEPAPAVSWPRPPSASDLLPGEVALKVAFTRFDGDQDPQQIDFSKVQSPAEDIVIITCFANPVFRVVEVLGGSAPDASMVTLYGFGSNYRSGSPEQILVGRLLPLKDTTRSDAAPAVDSPSAMLMPRSPPQ